MYFELEGREENKVSQSRERKTVVGGSAYVGLRCAPHELRPGNGKRSLCVKQVVVSTKECSRRRVEYYTRNQQPQAVAHIRLGLSVRARPPSAHRVRIIKANGRKITRGSSKTCHFGASTLQ